MRKNTFFKYISSFTLAVFIFSVSAPYSAHAGNWDFHGQPVPGTDTPQEKPKNPELPQGDPNNPPKKADPVFLHSGEYYYNFSDLTVSGRMMNIAISHLYRSSTSLNGKYGHGWTINYDYRLRPLSDGTVIVTSGDGRSDQYTAVSGAPPIGGFQFTHVAPIGVFQTIAHNTNGTWTLVKPHGEVLNFNSNGTIASMSDRNGNAMTFTYDAAGQLPVLGGGMFINPNLPTTNSVSINDYRLTHITTDNGKVVNFNYNSDGRLTSIVDQSTGRTVSYTYDPTTNDLLTVTKPATAEFPSGVTKTFTYDTNHQMLTVVDPKGQQVINNVYDTNGKVVTQTWGAGTFQFSYGTNSATLTDRVGNVTNYTLNAVGNILSEQIMTRGLRPTDPTSFTTTNTYNNDSMLTSVTYPAGNGVKYVYDDTNSDPKKRGNLLSIRRKTNMAAADNNTNDIVTTFTYEPNFNFVKTVTDPKGNVTTYTYDYELPTNNPAYGTKGNLLAVSYPPASTGNPAPTVNVQYNTYGQPVATTDPNGIVTTFTYDATSGYLTSVVRDAGVGNHINATTSFTYDNFGNIASITDANNHATTLVHNELNWLVSETSALGFQTKYTHDANGNVTKAERQASTTTPITWQTTQFTYTTLNDIATIADPLNRVTTFAYDANQNRTSVTDALGRITNYQYDERDLLFKTLDANVPVGVTQNNYDLNGNLAKIIDANGNATLYTYDGFDRQITQTFANATGHTYSYDKNDNLIVNTLPDTHTIVYDYDNLNRLTAKHYPQNTLGIDATFTYDLGSRMLSANNIASQITFTYDALNRVVAETQHLAPFLPGGGYTYSIGSGYDAVGNRTTLSYQVPVTLDYTYDADNRLNAINVFGYPLVNYSYDTLNRVTSRVYNSAVPQQEDFTYDIANQLTSAATVMPTYGASFSRNYLYNPVGNRTSKDLQFNTTSIGQENYSYNTIDELTGVSGAQVHNFSYDHVGNRQVVDAYNIVTNNINQYTQAGPLVPTYDLNGNTTSNGWNNLVYDEENRLIYANNPSHTSIIYLYDALNRRVSKTVDGNSIFYIHDGDQIAEERASDGTLNALFLYGNGIDEILAMFRAGNLYAYHHDALGSVDAIIDWAGNPAEFTLYDVYGNPSTTNSSIGNPFLFTGRQYDPETGLYYYRNRMYDPTLGRFLQRDPIGYADSMNMYAYVVNNPVNWVDPWGLETIRIDGEKWQLYENDVHTNEGLHYHNRTTGVKYYPDKNEFYNPKNKKREPAGNKWKKQWEKAKKDQERKRKKKSCDNDDDDENDDNPNLPPEPSPRVQWNFPNLPNPNMNDNSTRAALLAFLLSLGMGLLLAL